MVFSNPSDEINTSGQPTLWPRLFWAISCAIVLAAIGAGLSITGGPQHRRLIKLDNQRERDLVDLERNLGSYYSEKHQLPSQLSALSTVNIEAGTFVDPQTRHAYDYQKISNEQYRVCAVFSLPSPVNREYRSYDMAFSNHPQGKSCYLRVVDKRTVNHYVTFSSLGK